jgi:outer membrane protein assembly factor BamB
MKHRHGAIFLLIAMTSSVSIAQELKTTTIWRIETDAPIFTRPTLDGDTLFAAGEDGILRAIDKASGEIRWTYSARAAIGSTPGHDDTRVYVISRDGIVHGIDKATGESVWRFSTEGEKQWDYWDLFLSTPVPDGRHSLFFGSGDHGVYAINKRTGALRWRTETGGIVHGTPALSGEKVIVGGFDGKMYALDQASGSILWTFKTVGNSYFRLGEIPGSPTVEDGVVYFGSRDYNLYAVLEETGTGAWNERTPSWVVAQPLVADATVYVGTSDGPKLFSFDAKTGTKGWEVPLGLNVFGPAALIGPDHVAVAGLDGRVTFVHRETGTVAGYHDSAEATRNRSRFFDEDGTMKRPEIRSWEDLFALYDRFFGELGGIAAGLTAEEDVLYYATGGGGIAAVAVEGLPAE